jgi:hypothetical protein
LSKAGVSTNEVALLLLALTPDSTADASVDQVTQLSPTSANRNASQLTTEDKDFDRAQQFVKTMPLTEDTQNCIMNMQKIRENIKKELSQRGEKISRRACHQTKFKALKK